MNASLTASDLDVILQSLEHTRNKSQNYEYPSYEAKQERLKEVNDVIHKVRELKQTLKNP